MKKRKFEANNGVAIKLCEKSSMSAGSIHAKDKGMERNITKNSAGSILLALRS